MYWYPNGAGSRVVSCVGATIDAYIGVNVGVLLLPDGVVPRYPMDVLCVYATQRSHAFAL